MQQLLYISVAHKPLRQQAIMHLVAHARVRNRRNGITGTLIGSRRHFIQLLEGTQANLDKIYASVCHDSRHHAVLQLGRRDTKRRLLPDEDMGFDWSDGWPSDDRLSSAVTSMLGAIKNDAARRFLIRFASPELLP